MSLELNLRLSEDGGAGIYQQIRHQLSYLITTGRLKGETQLPSVRSLAEGLNVSRGTVSQAYRELQADNLIVSHRGKGMFVRSIDHVDPGQQARLHQHLTAILEDACMRATSLGFGHPVIQQRLGTLLSQRSPSIRTVFVATTDLIARRYAGRLEGHFQARNLKVASLSIDALANDRETASAVLDGVFFVITFALLRTEVQASLRHYRGPFDVLDITTEPTHDTTQQVSRLDPGWRILLVSEAQFQRGFVDLMRTQAGLPEGNVIALLDTQEREIREEWERVDAVVHSSGTTELLDRIGVPFLKRLELVFQISDSSCQKIERAVFHDSLGNWSEK